MTYYEIKLRTLNPRISTQTNSQNFHVQKNFHSVLTSFWAKSPPLHQKMYCEMILFYAFNVLKLKQFICSCIITITITIKIKITYNLFVHWNSATIQLRPMYLWNALHPGLSSLLFPRQDDLNNLNFFVISDPPFHLSLILLKIQQQQQPQRQ